LGEDALKFGAVLTLALVAITASSCGLLPTDKSKVRTVHEVLDNMNLWNGSVVKVAGYMPSCGGHDCTLFQTKREHDEFWRVIRDRKVKAETPDFLSIGYDAEFDRKAGGFAGRYVIVTGKISTKCRSLSGKPQCLDRAPDIIPVDIQAKTA
jgi:hypothetical protein